ncbi:MAG TPA: SBBP repeat-containing protein [Bryobacteraceae bacterium]|nr:SBBP repeat-containing protein [Bryobacteraceae bacterium]
MERFGEQFFVNQAGGGNVSTVIRLDMKLNLYLPFSLLAAGALAAGATPDAVRLLNSAPLRFEPIPDHVRTGFLARGAHFRFEFQSDQARLRVGSKDVRLRFAGASHNASLTPAQPLLSKTNLYLGNDPARWRTAIPNYGRLQVHGLYPGIDLAYYGNAGRLEYDLTVKPGADPRRIRLRLEGEGARLNRQGDLVADLIQKHPAAYQLDASGARVSVSSRYRRNADGSYGFALGRYDRSRDLVIDPVLLLGQYLGGSYQDIAYAIGHDSNGLIYISGTTQSSDWELVGNSLQTTEAGGQDLFLAIINPATANGPQVIYVTYLGGSLDETFGGMAVGPNGDVYLTGSTLSSDFPLENAAQTALGGTEGYADAFVVWLDPTQTLKFSTYLGGSGIDSGAGIEVDPQGKIWLDGNTQSTDLPVIGGFQPVLIGVQNMFVAGYDPSQTGSATLVYCIYIGGTHFDIASGLAVAADGSLWLAGTTYSPDIWMVGNSYEPLSNGTGKGYIAHIVQGLGANALVYSTFLGGSSIDQISGIVLDSAGRILVAGSTISTDFPVTTNALQPQYGGNTDAFVSVLDPTIANRPAQLVYSTYFGGSGADGAFGLARDSANILYVTGYTTSPDLVTTSNAAQPGWDYSLDVFGLKLNPSSAGAAGLLYSTYLGSDGLQVGYAADFDSKGNIYMAGFTSGPMFDPFGGQPKGTPAGNVDGFAVGLNTTPPATSTQ